MRFVAVLALLAACRPSATERREPASSSASTDSSPDPGASALVDAGDAQPQATLAPLPSGGFDELSLPGNRNRTVVVMPGGATTRRPIVVALHGMGDRPDWSCDAWRTITHARAWIVCPRGAHDSQWSTKNDERYAHRESLVDLAAHVDLALDALAKKYPDYVDTEHPILAGFSMGSWQVLRLAAREPERFTRIAIVEGGSDLAIANAKGLAQSHARVLFGSGQADSAAAAKGAAARLVAAGVPARTAFAPVGHAFAPPLLDALAPLFPWLTEGDARWAIEDAR